MVDTIFSSANFLGQTSGALLSAYVAQAGAAFTGSISGTTLTVASVSSGTIAAGQFINTGAAFGTEILSGSGASWTVSVSQTVPSGTAMSTADVGATFAKIHGTPTLAFGGSNYPNETVGGADTYYGANGTLASSQTQMDIQEDIYVSTTNNYVNASGIVIGDDGTGNNYCEIRLQSGTVFSAATVGVAIYNVVGGSGGGTALAVSQQTISASTSYTLLVNQRGAPGSYTLDVYFGPKGGALTKVHSAVSVPSLVMPGRYIGPRHTYYLSSGSASAAQTDASGQHIQNFVAATYSVSASITIASPTVAPTASAGSVTISSGAATGGTAPYSYQLQRAPQVNGATGTFANVGSVLTSPSTTDSGLTAGQVYYYRWLVTDSASTPNTANSSATAYTVPTPGFTLATNPASLLLTQGSSLAIAAAITNVGGYSGSPTLAVSGLPAGVTATVSGSTITFTAAGNAITGFNQVTVTASDGTLTQSVPVQLQVNPPTGVVYPAVSNVLDSDLVPITRNGSTEQVQASILKTYLSS